MEIWQDGVLAGLAAVGLTALLWLLAGSLFRWRERPLDAVYLVMLTGGAEKLDMTLRELARVCKPGGKIIIPTYLNRTAQGKTNRVSGAIGKAGADFKREFTLESYRQFFERAGYPDARYTLCAGRIPCAVAALVRVSF